MPVSVSPWASPNLPVPAAQIDGHALGRRRIARGVDPVAAVERVVAGAADQDVVANVAGQPVRCRRRHRRW